MTKPAAVFAQLIGALFAFFGLGGAADGSAVGVTFLVFGILLLVAGGVSIRNRLHDDQVSRDERASR